MTQPKPQLDLMSLQPRRLYAPPRWLIYGPVKVGKTALACNKVGAIILDVNDGSHEFEVMRFPFNSDSKRPFVPQTWVDLLGALNTLATQPHNFTRVVLDQLGDVQDLLWKHICQRDGKKNVISYGWGDGFKVAVDEWRLLCSKLDRLRTQRAMEVILLAHSHRVNVKDPTVSESYHRIEPMVHDLAQHFLAQWCDVIAFMDHEHGINTSEDEKARAYTTGLRVLHLSHGAAFKAGSRLPLPDKFIIPQIAPWSVIAEELAKVPDRLRAAIIAELKRLNSEDIRARVTTAVTAAGDNEQTLDKILRKLQAMKHAPPPKEEPENGKV